MIKKITLSQTETASSALHHIVITDVSGSMYGDLPALREDLKDNLADILRPDDQLSIIAFSGRNQVVDVVVANQVAGLDAYRKIQHAIDEKLQVIGLTGFRDPLERAAALAQSSELPVSVVFLTDGMDNQSRRQELAGVAQALGERCVAATYIEYGNYTDTALLSELAQASGGALLRAEQWKLLSPMLIQSLRDAPRSPRVSVQIPGQPSQVFALEAAAPAESSAEDLPAGQRPSLGRVLSFAPQAELKVSSHLGTLYLAYDNEAPEAAHLEDAGPEAAYALIAMGAQRRDGELMTQALKTSGDVRLIKASAGAFGVQPLADLAAEATEAAFNPAARLTEGYDPNLVPPDDALTLLDVLETLSAGKNFFLPDHPDFKYNRTGRARAERGDDFSDDEKRILEEKVAKAEATGDAEVIAQAHQEVQRRAAVKLARPRLEMLPQEQGYPINALTLNKTRANISAQISKPAELHFEGTLPSGVSLPETLPTQLIRNMSVIVDGRINVDVLPVRLDEATDAALRAQGLLSRPAGEVQVIKIRELPIVNRLMVRQADPQRLAELKVEETILEAAQKVYNHAWDQNFPKVSGQGLRETYGDAAADFLKEVGLSDAAYSPRSDAAPATDEYTSSELKLSFKNHSSLPKVDEAIVAIGAGKAKNGALMMKAPLEAIEALSAEAGDLAPEAASEFFKSQLSDLRAGVGRDLKKVRNEASRIRFAVLVGAVPIQEGNYVVTRGAERYEVKVEVREVTHKI